MGLKALDIHCFTAKLFSTKTGQHISVISMKVGIVDIDVERSCMVFVGIDIESACGVGFTFIVKPDYPLGGWLTGCSDDDPNDNQNKAL